ncbi:concanavalin A-like lectin/glucanase domain-containing protein [Triangularia verruculosa]|uniref:Concanavalin A-like lectin/glucanase domain-containing protein n=1 Tax=Triangularia verruculosa TaxID=2587418 RepID=A0AAN6X530_9PEZI|nr:concanavalin A-like lectin/glucanase domain-containing protein [Triangularia verruculosa]
MHISTYLSLPLLSSLASAYQPPSYDGYSLLWADTFSGPSATLPSMSNWDIIDRNIGVNNELQTYRANPKQIQLSGGQTLQIVPWRDPQLQWTSGRIESRYTFTPGAGKRTLVEAEIRFGGNDISQKQGIWPAFWLLGQSIRTGTGWPACGEVDIMETVNGELRGFGTVHCHVYPGGACNEPNGRGGAINIPNQGWQKWRVIFDRTSSDWRGESITWYMNGQQFHQVRGDQINDAGVWASLAQKPLFFILNVAVGGDWPGYPNGNTADGYGSMLEVGYVSHYST